MSRYGKIDWSEVDTKFKAMITGDHLSCGNWCKVIYKPSGEHIGTGLIVFETAGWREVQEGSEFNIYSYSHHNFIKTYE